jgi:DNA-binding NarL/FixJ family response regulator
VARALVLTADLLFGSNVQGMLAAVGQEAELVADASAFRDALVAAAPVVVIVDLTDEALQGVQTVTEMREEHLLGGIPVVGYYSHVEPGVRELALAEGFDLVVPRSRMARECPQLIEQVLGPD